MRTLSDNNAAAVGRTVTRPVFLVEIQLDPVLRLSSRGDIDVGSDTFLGANIDVDLRAQRFSLFNEGLQWSAAFLDGLSGAGVKVWKVWGEGPFASEDPDLFFDGRLGGGTVGDRIEYALRPTDPLRTPRLYVTPPTFNHLPPAGTRIIAPGGTFQLERG